MQTVGGNIGANVAQHRRTYTDLSSSAGRRWEYGHDGFLADFEPVDKTDCYRFLNSINAIVGWPSEPGAYGTVNSGCQPTADRLSASFLGS